MSDPIFEAVQAQERAFEQSPAMQATQASWQKLCYDLPLTVVSEWLHFASQRLQAQSDFIANLRSCHTMPQMMDVQTKFVRAAVDDYGAKTSKLMDDMRESLHKAA
jgi:hypothetical protein